MARKPQVTRTIKITMCKCLVVNLTEEKTEILTISVPRTYKDNKGLFKAAENCLESTQYKLVKIIETDVVVKRYGMSEAEFVSLANEI